VTDRLASIPYISGLGEVPVTLGCGAVTVKPPTRVFCKPPAAAGLVTITSYEFGLSDVFGHQKRTVVSFRNTNGVVALAMLPATVVPNKLPTRMVAPSTKFAPEIVTDRLASTPYTRGLGDVLVTVGCGATTVNPPVKAPVPPPAGLVTVTVCAAGASDVFGHQKRSWPLVTYTNGVPALAELPATVVPDRLPTVMVAPTTKLDPVIMT
jgi:hypothetical protein